MRDDMAAALRAAGAAEIRRFLAAGVVNTGVSYGVYAVFLWWGLPYPIANLLAMIAGVMIGFTTQGRYVFRKFEARRFPAFVLAWLLLWALNVGLIRLILPAAGGNGYIAGGAAMAVIVVISFAVQKYLVFGGGSAR